MARVHTTGSALFHGTTSRRAIRIDREGLLTHQRPRWRDDGNRRYVYLEPCAICAIAWATKSRRDVRPACYWIDPAMLDRDRVEDDPASRPNLPMLRHRGAIALETIARIGVFGTHDELTIVCYQDDAARVRATLPDGVRLDLATRPT